MDTKCSVLSSTKQTFLFFKVDSAWIAYNKPKSPELANEYAGFLMALGLNGHLTKLATLNIHDYLTKVHTKTYMHSNTFKIFSSKKKVDLKYLFCITLQTSI